MADPTGGGNVDVLVNIRAAGVEQATAAREAIAQLGTSSTATGTRMDQLATAFERMERREPTMVVRRSAFALEGLAASAIGAEGPLGRLAGTFALFAGGTGIGAAVLIAVAGLGAAYKALTADAHDLEEQHKKTAAAVQEFNVKAAGTAGQVRASLSGRGGEVPSDMRILGGEFGFGSGGAHVGEGLNERLANEVAAARRLQAEITQHEQAHDLAAGLVVLKDNLQAVQSQATETAREISGLNATLARAHAESTARDTGAPTAEEAQRAAIRQYRALGFAVQEAQEKLAGAREGLNAATDPAFLERLERIKLAEQGITGALADQIIVRERELRLLEQRMHAEGIARADRIQEFQTRGNQVGAIGAFVPGEGPQTFAQVQAAAARAEPIGIMASAAVANRGRTAQDRFTPDHADQFQEQVGHTVGELFSHMAAAATAGGQRTQQVMAQAVATLFDQLGQELVKHAHLSGFGGGLAAGAVGLVGGLLSGLFSHSSAAHVIIDGYDSRALTQQQQLLVALTGRKGVEVAILSAGQDPRQIAALLGRQSRTDSTSRYVSGG